MFVLNFLVSKIVYRVKEIIILIIIIEVGSEPQLYNPIQDASQAFFRRFTIFSVNQYSHCNLYLKLL